MEGYCVNPEKSTLAGIPPTRTTGLVVVSLSTKFPFASVAGAPFGGVTVTGPRPVHQRTITSLLMLDARVFRLAPKIHAGYENVLSLLLYASGRFTPVLSVAI